MLAIHRHTSSTMLDVMPEQFFLDLLDDPKGCYASTSLCRFCKNTKTKCYVQEKFFVGWCNFYLRLVGIEVSSLVDLWDWTNFLALLDGLGRDRHLVASSYCADGRRYELSYNWDIVQEYLIKENVIKSFISKGTKHFYRIKSLLCVY